MRKPILLALLTLLCSCSKNNSDSPATFQVQVSGLSAKTLLTFTVTDNTRNHIVILTEKNVSNGSYTSLNQVSPGDQLNINCTANVEDDVAGDGDGALEYYFKGAQMGAHGGLIGITGFTEIETVPQP